MHRARYQIAVSVGGDGGPGDGLGVVVDAVGSGAVEGVAGGGALVEERLALLSAEGGPNASLHITDLTDSEGRPAGTRVEISIPDSMIQKQIAEADQDGNSR